MIKNEDLKNGRVKVMSGEEYAAMGIVHLTDRGRIGRMDFVLTGCLRTSERVQVPHPGFTGYEDNPETQENGVVTLLRREQAEHLALELLKALNGGVMPDDSAELVDFISSLGR